MPGPYTCWYVEEDARVSHASPPGTKRWRTPLATLPRSTVPELLDEPGHAPAELVANFRDIQRVNRLLGGTRIILRALPRLLRAIPPGQTVAILDLATGAGDIPLAIARWARRRGVPVAIIASDSSDEILEIAARQLATEPMITLARHDARAVPLPDRQFDIVLCSLALHHFSPDDAVRVLREMDRLARVGFVVNDLRRSRVGYGAAWLAARLTTRNRLTRHDAPLSVRRAFTPDELGELLRRAGIRRATITTHPWFRMAAVTGGGPDAT